MVSYLIGVTKVEDTHIFRHTKFYSLGGSFSILQRRTQNHGHNFDDNIWYTNPSVWE